jgi:predicted flap endonuclease-1-like 5' DNA nuclease
MSGTPKEIVSQLQDAARLLDALLRSEEPSRVLAQLRQRETDGAPLEAIDHEALRAELEGEIARHPFALAAEKLAEAIALIEALPARSSGERVVAEQPSAPASAAITVMPDDLTLVRGIDEALAGRLAHHGITRFAELAGLPAAAVRQLTADAEIGDAIHRDGWIEQAAVLAAGRATRFAERRLRARGGMMPPEQVAEPALAPVELDTRAPSATAPERVAATAAGTIDRPAVPPPLPMALIRGIDRSMAARLARIGVTGTPQIAAWTAADTARVRTLLGLGDRIAREGWIEQAALLAKGQPTEHVRRRGAPPPLVPRPPPPAAPIPSQVLDRGEAREPRMHQDLPLAPAPASEPPPLSAPPPRAREGSLLAMLAEIEAAVALTVAIAEGMQANEPRRPADQDAPVPARSRGGEDVEVLIRPRVGPAPSRPADQPAASPPAPTPRQAVEALVIGDNGEEASFEIRAGGASVRPMRRTRLQELREAEAERRLTDEKSRAIKRLMTALRGSEKPH